MELKKIQLAALAAIVAVTGTGSVMLAQQLPGPDSAIDQIEGVSAVHPGEATPAAPVPPVSAPVAAGDEDTDDDDRTSDGQAAIRRHEEDVNSEALDDDEDDARTADGDGTRGDDGTAGGNNTGDGDGTRGDDGTAGGNNTGDASNTGNGGTTG